MYCTHLRFSVVVPICRKVCTLPTLMSPLNNIEFCSAQWEDEWLTEKQALCSRQGCTPLLVGLETFGLGYLHFALIQSQPVDRFAYPEMINYAKTGLIENSNSTRLRLMQCRKLCKPKTRMGYQLRPSLHPHPFCSIVKANSTGH